MGNQLKVYNMKTKFVSLCNELLLQGYIPLNNAGLYTFK